MQDDMEHDDNSRRYELNKKYQKARDQDKKIRSPVCKGSVRSQSKKALKKYIDIFSVNGVEDDEYFDDFIDRD